MVLTNPLGDLKVFWLKQTKKLSWLQLKKSAFYLPHRNFERIKWDNVPGVQQGKLSKGPWKVGFLLSLSHQVWSRIDGNDKEKEWNVSRFLFTNFITYLRFREGLAGSIAKLYLFNNHYILSTTWLFMVKYPDIYSW